MKRFNTNSTAEKVVLNTLLTSALLLILSGFTFTTAVSAAELVVNGGFEYPEVTAKPSGFGWTTYYGQNFSGSADCPTTKPSCNDGTLVPGWSVFWTDDFLVHEQINPGRLEIQIGKADFHDFPTPLPYEGLQKAELDSHHRVDILVDEDGNPILDDDGNTQLNKNTNVTIAQLLPTCPLTAYTLNYAWKSRTHISGDNTVRVVVGDNEVNLHGQNEVWMPETVDFVSDNSNETLLLFGSIGTESTHGMFLDAVSVTNWDGSDTEDCSLVCDDKPMEITLRYDGDDDSLHYQQGNEVIISPETVDIFPEDAIIMVYGHKKRNRNWLGTFPVAIGEFFTVSGPRKRIPPRLTFEIYNDNGDFFQTVTFHTSCSQPMDAGDEFGAITVWSAIN